MSDTQKEFLRQFISNYVKGPNVEALLGTLGDAAQRLQDTTMFVSDQLTICTAVGEYLDRGLSQVGITRPPDLGMADLAYRNMGIQINAQKQITSVLHSVLATFYGDESIRASAISGQPEPYLLSDADELMVELESGDIYTIPFLSTDFVNITAATVQEVADVISRFMRTQNINSFANIFDSVSGKKFVRIFGSAQGPFSAIKILGGRVQSVLEFPTLRPTELANNATVWEVTRTTGSTIRFRWYSGFRPNLESVLTGDTALIYGSGFVLQGLSGTFAVKDLRPSLPVPAYDSGWFEVENPEVQNLRSTPPDVAPQPNTPSDTYSLIVSQAEYTDLKFYLPKKNTSYGQARFALAFEAKNDLLKIYLPATTQVVARDLISGAHLHPLYDQNNLNGSFGDIQIINDCTVRYPQMGYDNQAYSGTLSYGLTDIEIDYVSRQNFYTTVVCKSAHGLIGDTEWISIGDYLVGDEVFYDNATWVANIDSGPSFGGARIPNHFTTYWTFVGSGQNLSSTVVNIHVDEIEYEKADTWLGPHILDPAANYSLTDIILKSREKILQGTKIKTIFVNGLISPEPGLFLVDLNRDTQEGPIPYLSAQAAGAPTAIPILNLSQNGHNVIVSCVAPHGAISGSRVNIQGVTTVSGINGFYTVDIVLSPTSYTCTSLVSRIASVVNEGTSSTVLEGAVSTLLVDPSYTFKQNHAVGADITLLSDRRAYVPEPDGSDYSFYLTGTVEGRTFCESLIRQITALGIKLQIKIVYPSGDGLGHGLAPTDSPTINNDVVYVWG